MLFSPAAERYLKKLKDNNLVIIKVINYKRTIYLSNEVRNKLLDV